MIERRGRHAPPLPPSPLLPPPRPPRSPCMHHNAGTLPSNLLSLFYEDSLSSDYGVTINLSYNNLYGTLPSDWASAYLLIHTLDLSHNYLTGTLPYYYAYYSFMGLSTSTFSFQYNSFSGSLPEYWIWYFPDNINYLNVSNNPCLCGSIMTGLSTYVALWVH